MARQTASIEINDLSQGLVSDASPLNFPENASLDEQNFSFTNTGARERRLGLDYEALHSLIDLNEPYDDTDEVVTSYLWRNAGNVPSLTYLVVQFNRQLLIFRTDTDQLSSEGLLYRYEFDDAEDLKPFSYATTSGYLIVASGRKEVIRFEAFPSDTGLSGFFSETARLEIRDLFGVPADYDVSVEDETSSSSEFIDLTDPKYAAKRPIPSGLLSASTSENCTYSDSNASSDFIVLEFDIVNNEVAFRRLERAKWIIV